MSILRWAGSKRQLCEVLSHCWHASQLKSASGRYIEGFMGSASLFFRIQPPKALLVDVNARLIECFEQVRIRASQVSDLLDAVPKSEFNYYFLRETNDEVLSPEERAARFIYLNRFCFNGLYRTNQSGKFNVPYGGAKSGNLPDRAEIARASIVLKKATIRCGDFSAVVGTEATRGDFVYLDPPYARVNSTLDNQYGPDNFGLSDLARLFDLAAEIDRRGAHFVISYANCEEIAEFSSRWNSHQVSVKRTIAANVQHRKSENEVLITNL